ncbi:uncharacterized protein TNIN_89331 [Trichonephila inaurata madagascariensis]|uniref:Uncharacterized protein n=1 Tax=Trichonephila inaurata madagascariensis TaxID=2747483 RepID=A0A8X6Y8N1_9ARAC|nr:uncharacterized protein TNIN_89331 [Trichonephila inaurata madagascariensis]
MACAFPKDDEIQEILELAGLSENTIRVKGEKKFVVVGNKGCGKSSFIECFLIPDRKHPEIFTPEHMRKMIVRNKQILNLVFRELPSSDSEFDVYVRSQAYPGSFVVCLCFAIDDRESFWDILKWNDEAKKYAPYTKFFVIGCKMDNRLDNGTVSMEEGLSMSMLIQAVKYYECSSVTGIRVALAI